MRSTRLHTAPYHAVLGAETAGFRPQVIPADRLSTGSEVTCEVPGERCEPVDMTRYRLLTPLLALGCAVLPCAAAPAATTSPTHVYAQSDARYPQDQTFAKGTATVADTVDITRTAVTVNLTTHMVEWRVYAPTDTFTSKDHWQANVQLLASGGPTQLRIGAQVFRNYPHMSMPGESTIRGGYRVHVGGSVYNPTTKALGTGVGCVSWAASVTGTTVSVNIPIACFGNGSAQVRFADTTYAHSVDVLTAPSAITDHVAGHDFVRYPTTAPPVLSLR